jgi:alkylhydroperoxidase family enzyme
MARVPLIQEQDHPELAEVIEKYRSGRRGKLINMYRMLLNAPALAESWFNHSNTVRWKTSLDGRLREIVIIRMGHLTGAQYVLRQHVPSLAARRGAHARGMRCARGLAAVKIVHRARARRPRLCRFDDPRHHGAG